MKQQWEGGFSLVSTLVLIGLVVVMAMGAFVVWKRANTADTPRAQLIHSDQPKQLLPKGQLSGCGAGPVFDHIPMELSDFKAWRPLGFVALPIHIFGAKHSNFTINLPGEQVHGRPVVFPSDATVTNIVSTASASGTGYQLTFYPCQELKSYFFHLESIAPVLESAFQAGSPQCQDFTFDTSGPMTKCELKASIVVKSGELAGASDHFGGVDWGAVDTRVTNQFANPNRYDGDYPHYTSPLLYLRPDLLEQMLPKIGSYDGQVLRTAEPRTGSLLQDVKGAAQGNWWIGDANFYTTHDFSPFLALLHDYVDPTQPEFAMGTSVPGAPTGIYSFAIQSSGLNNRDFADVKPDGQVYCYDSWLNGRSAGHLPLTTPPGAILLHMPTATELQVEHQAGTCATPHALTEAATTFDR